MKLSVRTNFCSRRRMVMAQFKQNSNKIVQNLQEKLDKSLYEQREMSTDMVRSSVMHEPMPKMPKCLPSSHR